MTTCLCPEGLSSVARRVWVGPSFPSFRALPTSDLEFGKTFADSLHAEEGDGEYKHEVFL